jgi:hypothetical protein
MTFNFWQAINNDWNSIKMLKDMADLTYIIIWWCKTNNDLCFQYKCLTREKKNVV